MTGALAKDAAMDFSVYGLTQGEGYGRNFFTGLETGKMNHDIAFRSKLLFEPSDLTQIRLTADYSNRDHNDLFGTPAPGLYPTLTTPGSVACTIVTIT